MTVLPITAELLIGADDELFYSTQEENKCFLKKQTGVTTAGCSVMLALHTDRCGTIRTALKFTSEKMTHFPKSPSSGEQKYARLIKFTFELPQILTVVELEVICLSAVAECSSLQEKSDLKFILLGCFIYLIVRGSCKSTTLTRNTFPSKVTRLNLSFQLHIFFRQLLSCRLEEKDGEDPCLGPLRNWMICIHYLALQGRAIVQRHLPPPILTPIHSSHLISAAKSGNLLPSRPRGLLQVERRRDRPWIYVLLIFKTANTNFSFI